MQRRHIAILAAAWALAGLTASTPALAGTPATVTVRVEGATSTLLALKTVTTTTTPTPVPGNCSGTTAAGVASS
jgi:hypothetical protein